MFFNVTDLYMRTECRLVFSCLRNCSGCMEYDFREGGARGREFQHVGPESAKALEPNVMFLYVESLDCPGLQPTCEDEL